ncbi:MAG TPA: 2-dehydropantoate 2-reductase [Synergistaceae bacterium]|nr:2-dehydropantoate 2-reductase [Synergistaceae bacterium]
MADRVVILGSGAMGSLYGGMLAEAGVPVTLVDVWKEHMDAVNRDGLIIEGVSGDRVVRSLRGVTDPREAGEADLVLVFVKATMTKAAMEGARCLLGPDTAVLTLQNGLGNAEKLSDVAGASRVLAGITGHGCNILGPGRIRHAGTGDTILGELDGSATDRLARIAALFGRAGFSVKTSSNVLGMIWAKLLVNVGINALTAVTGLKNGRLVELPEADELLEAAVREAMAVAERKGIRVEAEDPVAHTRDVARRTAANRSSMLQDVSAERQTEIDVINGAIVDEGKRLGVPTPVNLCLANLIRIRQQTYEEREK